MYSLEIKPTFDKSFSKIRDKIIKKQIWKKILQLKTIPRIGKKLVGNPFWSLRIAHYRVIYHIDENKKMIEILDVILRKHDYRELN